MRAALRIRPLGQRPRLDLAACVLALTGALLLAAAPHAAADSTIKVAGTCTLQDAVAYADGTAEPGCAPGLASGTTTITLPASAAPYTVSSTLQFISGANVILNGAGVTSSKISGGGGVQVINVASGALVTLKGVTITGGISGVPTTGCSGSAILHDRSCPAENGNNGGGLANAGTLTLESSTVTGNIASSGTAPFAETHPFLPCSSAHPCAPAAGMTAGNGGNGGGIYNTGTLTVTSSTISDNAAGAGGTGTGGFSGTGADASAGQIGGNGGIAGAGGGIDNTGTLTVTNSSITSNNAGNGGGAGAGSTATATNAAGGNAGSAQPGGDGGAVANSASLTLQGSTLSGNDSGVGGDGASAGGGNGSGAAGASSASAPGGSGGAIFIQGLQAETFQNDTIASNTASAGGAGGAAAGPGGDGGGLFMDALSVSLQFVTVAHNVADGADGGLDNGSIGVLSEADSIVASNTAGGAPSNCSTGATIGKVTDGGSNVVFGEPSCPGVNADPKLGPLAANGGPTATLALASGSAAIGLVPLNDCPLTSDQRGVSRPQSGTTLGTHCDAGAYELAPPVIAAASGTGTSSNTAAVIASINPNAQPTSVTVNYGTTTAYGSSVTAPAIVPTTGPVSVTAPIGGLSPNTTYHAQIIATNADGTTSSTDITFSTLSVSIASTSSNGAVLALQISCQGATSTTTCSGPITLTTVVRSRHSTTVEMVGSGSYSVANGRKAIVHVTLNRNGQKLLDEFYTLPVMISLDGSTPLTQTITIRYTVIRSPISYTFTFSRTSSVAQELTISGIPAGGKVTVICHGGGCPFSRRTFAPRHGQVALSPALVSHPLLPRATLELEITAANDVGKVAIFTIRSGHQPSLSELCLPPGTSRPSRCA